MASDAEPWPIIAIAWPTANRRSHRPITLQTPNRMFVCFQAHIFKPGRKHDMQSRDRITLSSTHHAVMSSPASIPYLRLRQSTWRNHDLIHEMRQRVCMVTHLGVIAMCVHMCCMLQVLQQRSRVFLVFAGLHDRLQGVRRPWRTDPQVGPLPPRLDQAHCQRPKVRGVLHAP